MNVNGQSFSALNYDVMSFNGFVGSTGDIAGRGLIQNNAKVGSGWSVGYFTHSLSTDLSLQNAMIVGSNFTFPSGAVYPDGSNAYQKEGLFVGGSFNGPAYLGADVTGSCSSPSCLSSQFSALQQCYGSLQSSLQSQSDNVAFGIQWSELTVNCTSPQTTYFMTLSSTQMTQYSYVTLNGCSATARWVINVVGTGSVTFTGASFPAANGAITYNVQGSGRTIHVHDTNLNANLFAPFNTLQQASGVINGRVVAGDITASLQMNKAQCFTPQ